MRSGIAAMWVLISACGPEGFALGLELDLTAPHDDRELWFTEDGWAHLRITRTHRNLGASLEDVQDQVTLPSGAVITALRARSGGQWVEARSSPSAEQAEELLAGQGEPVEGAHPAVGAWAQDGTATVVVRGLAPERSVEVQFDVRAPLTYASGAWTLELEGREPRLLPGGPRVVRVEREDEAYDEDGHEDDEPVLGSRRYIVERPPFGPLQLRWATLPLPSGRTGYFAALEAGRELAPVPRGARWVFAVDVSRSMGEAGIEQQVALIPRVLAFSPGAEVEVVLFHRQAERLFGRFIPAALFASELARVPPGRFRPRNGSNLDVAAAEVARLLRNPPGPGRGVLFTDEELRASFSPEIAAEALAGMPHDTVVHLISDAGRSEWVEHTFDHVLTPLPHATGGVMLHVSDGWRDEAQGDAPLEVLVRPLAFERAQLLWDGAPYDEDGGGEDLCAGEAETESGVQEERGLRALRAVGYLWSRRVELSPAQDPALQAALPARLVGSERYWDEEADLAYVALKGQVASTQTPLVVPRGEDAPLPQDGPRFGLHGYGTTCGCRGSGHHGFGRAGIATLGSAPDPRTFIAAAVTACSAESTTPVRVGAWMEVRSAEILEVGVQAEDAALAACVAARLWDTHLPLRIPNGVHAFEQ